MFAQRQCEHKCAELAAGAHTRLTAVLRDLSAFIAWADKDYHVGLGRTQRFCSEFGAKRLIRMDAEFHAFSECALNMLGESCLILFPHAEV
jgi:hypothetical protein